MKDFLKKYLTDDQIKDVEAKYLAEHPDAKGLPVYISKSRLDEVLGQKRTAEESAASHKKQFEELQGSVETQVSTAVKKAQDDATAHESAALAELKTGFTITEAIYKAKGRNVVAIKALIDPKKKIEEEIARLQKSDSYLFEDDIPNGTGKDGAGSGSDANQKELDMMRAAVGI